VNSLRRPHQSWTKATLTREGDLRGADTERNVEYGNTFGGKVLGQGWCREREKIDWQEAPKFGCPLGRTINYVTVYFILSNLHGSCQKIKF